MLLLLFLISVILWVLLLLFRQLLLLLLLFICSHFCCYSSCFPQSWFIVFTLASPYCVVIMYIFTFLQNVFHVSNECREKKWLIHFTFFWFLTPLSRYQSFPLFFLPPSLHCRISPCAHTNDVAMVIQWLWHIPVFFCTSIIRWTYKMSSRVGEIRVLKETVIRKRENFFVSIWKNNSFYSNLMPVCVYSCVFSERGYFFYLATFIEASGQWSMADQTMLYSATCCNRDGYKSLVFIFILVMFDWKISPRLRHEPFNHIFLLLVALDSVSCRKHTGVGIRACCIDTLHNDINLFISIIIT